MYSFFQKNLDIILGKIAGFENNPDIAELAMKETEAGGWEDNNYKHAVKTPSRQHACLDQYQDLS